MIYGLDDGAKTLKDSISMINMAYEDGIRSIIATPHYHHFFRYDIEEMTIRFRVITENISEHKPEMKLYLGNECYLDENLLSALLTGKCRTLAGSQYVLIEISNNAPITMTKMMLADIIMNGYIPIIAHCERLIANKDDLLKVSELRTMGCLLQINASTIVEPQQDWLRNWIYNSLKNQTISFIASDAHDAIHRRPILNEAYSIIQKKVGVEIANKLFFSNAQNKIIDAPSPDLKTASFKGKTSAIEESEEIKAVIDRTGYILAEAAAGNIEKEPVEEESVEEEPQKSIDEYIILGFEARADGKLNKAAGFFISLLKKDIPNDTKNLAAIELLSITKEMDNHNEVYEILAKLEKLIPTVERQKFLDDTLQEIKAMKNT